MRAGFTSNLFRTASFGFAGAAREPNRPTNPSYSVGGYVVFGVCGSEAGEVNRDEAREHIRQVFELPAVKAEIEAQRRNEMNTVPVYAPRKGDFWSRVKADESGCWLWMGARYRIGGTVLNYGIVRRGKKTKLAHRIAWESVNGSIPVGRLILHHCDNPPCVNPQHLYVGTYADNNRDRARRNRNANVKGARNPGAKLTEEQVKTMIEAYRSGKTAAEAGRVIGISYKHAWRILKGGQLWQHLL